MRHPMSVAKSIWGMQCVQAPMAFAGFHGSTDESQLVQPRSLSLAAQGPTASLRSALLRLCSLHSLTCCWSQWQLYSCRLGVSSCHLCHERGGSCMTLPVVQASERPCLQWLRCAGDQERVCHEVQPG